MNGLIVFTKKEIMEQIRSYKALVLLAVLFLFGMMSPLFAKITPEILANLPMQGVTITVPEPTVLDAWAQFFKNMSQMGLIVLLLIFGRTLSQEISKGTLVIPLSKGLSRQAVIGAKYLASVVTWTVGYVLAALTSCGYTLYLFGRFAEPNLLFALFCLWLFGVFLLAILLLASTIAPGSYGGLLITAAILGILLILNVFPMIQRWNPITLAAQNDLLLKNAAAAEDIASAVWTALASTLVCLGLSAALFQKKKL